MEEIYITNSLEETESLGKKIADKVQNYHIIGLYGDLGVGKTIFVKGFAKGFGIKARITSPTFVIVKEYDIKAKEYKKFFHVDLYRVGKSDIKGLGLKEILNDKKAICIIEWADKAENLLSKFKNIKIFFKDLGGDKREIKIRKL